MNPSPANVHPLTLSRRGQQVAERPLESLLGPRLDLLLAHWPKEDLVGGVVLLPLLKCVAAGYGKDCSRRAEGKRGNRRGVCPRCLEPLLVLSVPHDDLAVAPPRRKRPVGWVERQRIHGVHGVDALFVLRTVALERILLGLRGSVGGKVLHCDSALNGGKSVPQPVGEAPYAPSLELEGRLSLLLRFTKFPHIVYQHVPVGGPHHDPVLTHCESENLVR
mmetsp:Transcript_5526/g.13004  ORF Transcript_5526/g.13004 Transcript_5526/m.13004 type:complete len:220 (+) Transcript_5526:46-705(+)